MRSVFLALALAALACEPPLEPPPPDPPAPDAEAFSVTNAGLGTLEGHTPRGFQGQGTGLFVGDNLNAGFPEGEGVQAFISMDLAGVPAGEVVSATFSSENASTSGDPFGGLGDLTAEEVRFDAFSSALFDQEPVPGSLSCTFSTSAEGPFSCDVAEALQRALDDGRSHLQFRLRLDLAGDNDGAQDLVMFFLTDSNTNEPGIFDLSGEVVPD